MKKRKLIISALTMLLIGSMVFAGCAKKEEPIVGEEPMDDEEPIGEEKPGNGIAVNEIEFEIIGFDALNGELQNEVDQLKLERGYNYWESDGGYILLIASGLKATGGFGIEVLLVEDNEGKTNVSVSETSPDPDAMVTQAIEYPFVLIQFKGTTDDFSIVNQDGEAFDRKEVDLSAQETVEGIYVGQIDNNSIEVTVGEDFMVFRNYIMGELISGIESGDAVKVTYQLTEEGQYQLIRIEALE
jgi:hypothetical protein